TLDRRPGAVVRRRGGHRLPCRQPREHLGDAHPPRPDELRVVRRPARADRLVVLDWKAVDMAFEHEREQMVVRQLESRGIHDARVLDAMRRVPRHRFVPSELIAHAYEDTPLPIGEQQTISQPYIVALMSEALAVGASARLLEIGTGSGYQAAVLATMGAQVLSIELVPSLALQARSVLAELGLDDRVRVLEGDGTLGAPDDGPYDGIIVTAGAPQIPRPLLSQL